MTFSLTQDLWILITICVALFAFCCTASELLRATQTSPSGHSISYYLTGPYGWIEDFGFVAMSVGIALMGRLADPNAWPAVFGYIVGAAVFGAFISDRWLKKWLGEKTGEAIHLFCAAAAFITALGFELSISIHFHSWFLGVITILYPLSVLVVWRMWPKQGAWIEKTAAGAIILFGIAFPLWMLYHSLHG